MANQASPSIKDNPFKRLDALRTKVSGVKSRPVPLTVRGTGRGPATRAAAPPERRVSGVSHVDGIATCAASACGRT